MIGLGVGFLTQIFLARVLGIHLFGDYKIAFSWITLFSTIALVGNTSIITKLTSYKPIGYMKELVSKITRQSELFFLIISIVFYFIVSLFKIDTYNSISFKICYLITFIFGVINILNKILQASLLGHFMNYVVNISSMILLPIVKMIIIFILYIISKNNYFILCNIILAEIIIYIYSKKYYLKINKGIPKEKITRKLIYNNSFFFITIGYYLLGATDIMILSFWFGSDVVGGYSAAASIAALIMTFCTAFTSFIPKIAKLYHDNQTDILEKMYLRITKIISIMTLPLLIYFIFFNKMILGFYGEPFTKYSSVLIILSISYMLDAGTGPTGALLNMTEFENTEMKFVLSLFVINVILNLLLIPIWGPNGAALATLISYAAINIIKLFTCYRLMNIATFSIKHIYIYLLFFSVLFFVFILSRVFYFDLLKSILLLLFVYFIFFLVAYTTRLISQEEIRSILKA